MYPYNDKVFSLSEIQEIKLEEEVKKEKEATVVIEKTEQQSSLEEDKINHQHQNSFSMLTNFISDKFAEVDDKIDMFQKAQAGTRQQISELHSMLNELLFRERSK